MQIQTNISTVDNWINILTWLLCFIVREFSAAAFFTPFGMCGSLDRDASFNLLTPLGRSSPRPGLNPPESTGGTFTRQPQSLQDHQNSSHPSVWRRSSGAGAGGVYINSGMTPAGLISRQPFNQAILYRTQEYSQRVGVWLIHEDDQGAKMRCEIFLELLWTITFILNHTFGGKKKHSCES